MMSASTTSYTFNRVPCVPSLDTIQKSLLYHSTNNNNNHNNNNNNNNIVTSATYYHFPQDINTDYALLSQPKTTLTSEETLLLEKALRTHHHNGRSNMGILMHKSNSYSGGIIKPKSTILKQDSINGRVNTSLTTDSVSECSGMVLMPKTSCSTPGACTNILTLNSQCLNETSSECDAFLMDSNTKEVTIVKCANNRRLTRSSSKSRLSICYRAHNFISRNSYISYLVPLSILFALMFVAYLTRDYAKRLLYWIETQNHWIIFAIFMLLFVIVSFPIVVGYFVLMITAGYLFGCIKGFLTVILGANMGIAIAHLTLRSLRHRIPIQRLIKNETGRAILRVISGPRAFRVVLFTRLTPIPFGIQNAIFGISSINPRVYHTATFLGLLPAQMINVYLGSTLRSMHEVLSNHGTAITGYISFGVEVICGVVLMCWVVHKARKELSQTLLTDISNDGKLIDIQV
uniref:VTT domain-containing protein n=1 Tax=Glossina palpalis gambiensis TaxID=67801 RepID=A0A1B0B6X8_9MUSC